MKIERGDWHQRNRRGGASPRVNGAIQTYQCSFCEKTFGSNKAVITHESMKHHKHLRKLAREYGYTCRFCEQFFEEDSTRNIHEQSYHHKKFKNPQKYTQTVLEKQSLGTSSFSTLLRETIFNATEEKYK